MKHSLGYGLELLVEASPKNVLPEEIPGEHWVATMERNGRLVQFGDMIPRDAALAYSFLAEHAWSRSFDLKHVGMYLVIQTGYAMEEENGRSTWHLDAIVFGLSKDELKAKGYEIRPLVDFDSVLVPVAR